MTNHLGELLAISTAVTWAFGATFFGMAGNRASAVLVNAIRLPGGALILWGIWAVTTGTAWPTEIGLRQHFWLGLSGTLGLALGDSFYYKGIMMVGPRRASLMLAATPVVASLVAWPVLDERLGTWAVLGIVVVLAGILIAVLGRDEGSGDHHKLSRDVLLRGLGAALICAVCSAVGNVFAKLGMPGETQPLGAALVRGWWATAAMGLFLLGRPSVWRDLPKLRDPVVWKLLSVAIILGPSLGMWAAVTSMKLTDVGVASVLMNTVPVTVMLPAWIFHRDKPSAVSVIGVAVAIAGGAILMLT